MLYLFSAVLCSAAIALILKFSESKNLNRMIVTNSNYVVATATSLFFVFKDKLLFKEKPDFHLFVSELDIVVKGGTFSESSNLLWAVSTGFFAGILYFLGLIYMQKSIKENGVGITGAFSKIGIFIPMVLSIIFWKEIPDTAQWLGIILAISAIMIASYTPGMKDSAFKLRKSLLIVFTVVGLSEFSTKFFQNYAYIEYKSLFLAAVFSTAFFISFIEVIRGKNKFTKEAVITGILVGIPNMFTSFFLISSFKYLKTTIAFPAFSAGTIVFINIGGYFIFGEKIKRKDFLSIVLTIVAVILMSGFSKV